MFGFASWSSEARRPGFGMSSVSGGAYYSSGCQDNLHTECTAFAVAYHLVHFVSQITPINERIQRSRIRDAVFALIGASYVTVKEAFYYAQHNSVSNSIPDTNEDDHGDDMCLDVVTKALSYSWTLPKDLAWGLLEHGSHQIKSSDIFDQIYVQCQFDRNWFKFEADVFSVYIVSHNIPLPIKAHHNGTLQRNFLPLFKNYATCFFHDSHY